MSRQYSLPNCQIPLGLEKGISVKVRYAALLETVIFTLVKLFLAKEDDFPSKCFTYMNRKSIEYLYEVINNIDVSLLQKYFQNFNLI